MRSLTLLWVTSEEADLCRKFIGCHTYHTVFREKGLQILKHFKSVMMKTSIDHKHLIKQDNRITHFEMVQTNLSIQ